MHGKSVKLLSFDRRRTWRAIAGAATAAAVGALATAQLAGAAIDFTSIDITGPGAKERGRELGIRVRLSNASTDPQLTPEQIRRLRADSPSIRFNGKARSVKRCKAKIPKNGDGAACPGGSKVGSGTFAGIFGTPGQSASEFGVLSAVTGRITIFNYEPKGSDQARMIAVVKARAPFAGVAFNMRVRVTKAGVLTIDIPKLRDLPRIVRRSYPSTTKFVLTKLDANIAGRRERNGRPFVWRRWNNRFQLNLQATG